MNASPRKTGMRARWAAVWAVMAAVVLSGVPAGADFEETGYGARAAGMANSFVGLADDVYAVVYNPAGLGKLAGPEFTASYRKLFWGLTDKSELDESFLAAAYPLDADGRRGTLGAAVWDYRAGDLYRENMVFLSYGRTLKDIVGRNAYAGIAVKALTKQYAKTLYTENAIDFLGESFGQDPVFAGGYSKTVIAVDAAVLVPLGARATAGLVVKNINGPDTGLAEKVIVPLDARGGVCFKGDRLNILADAQYVDGDFTAGPAFERFVFKGQAAVRGGLAIGSRGRAGVTLGASTRFAGLRVDYSFELPLRGVQKTMGTHGMSVVVFFGEPGQARVPSTVPLADGKAGPGLRAYLEAMRQMARKEYVRAYESFRRLADNPNLGYARESDEKADEIRAEMQRLAAKGNDSQKLYARGFAAFVDKRYAVCLTYWQLFLSAHGAHREIAEYINRLSSLSSPSRRDETRGYIFDRVTATPAP